MVYSFPIIVKDILKDLPKKDYPVLNSRLFVSCWIGFSLDKSLTSMRDLFRRLKVGGINLDISTCLVRFPCARLTKHNGIPLSPLTIKLIKNCFKSGLLSLECP